jgi:hypothetical protein
MKMESKENSLNVWIPRIKISIEILKAEIDFLHNASGNLIPGQIYLAGATCKICGYEQLFSAVKCLAQFQSFAKYFDVFSYIFLRMIANGRDKSSVTW